MDPVDMAGADSDDSTQAPPTHYSMDEEQLGWERQSRLARSDQEGTLRGKYKSFKYVP
jgi:hypothetical protein